MNQELWSIIDHACRHCMGRLLQRTDAHGQTIIRCAECGSTETGDHTALCWCGVTVLRQGYPFKCYRNPRLSLEVPQEILVCERPLSKTGLENPDTDL